MASAGERRYRAVRLADLVARPQPPTVAVAMSGGVDSSVAAALLVEQGYEVVGVMMRLWAEEENRCCAPQAVDDARQVAAQLDIRFYLVNYEAQFKARVVDYFIAEYSQGRTPNPCLFLCLKMVEVRIRFRYN